MSVFGFIGQMLGFTKPRQRQRVDIFRTSTAEGLPILYGTHKITPISVYKSVSKNNAELQDIPEYLAESVHSTDKDKSLKYLAWLHRVEVLCHGPISGIEGHLIDGDPHTQDRFQKEPHLRLIGHYGNPGQLADSSLVAALPRWTASHRGDGVAYIAARYFNSRKKPQFRSEPTHEVIVRGLKLYDPRRDPAAGGTGLHSATDPQTWDYSENRVLIILNYLMADYGAAFDGADIDLESFKLAADIADSEVAIPARATNTSGATLENYYDRFLGFGVTVQPGDILPGNRVWQQPAEVTQPRYHGAAKLDPKTSVVDNLKTLLEGFGWSLPWSNGRHKLVLEGPATPVMHIDETEIYGVGHIKRGGRAERLNRVTIEFPNRNLDFEQDSVSWPGLQTQTFQDMKAADENEVLHTTVSARTITDRYRAEEWAEFLVRRSRADLRIAGIKVSAKALVLEPGDVITVSLPDRDILNKAMIVEKVEVSSWLDVTLDLLEYDQTVYGLEPHDAEIAGDGIVPENPWADPPAIENFQASAYHERKPDGVSVSGFDLVWDEPDNTIGIAYIELAWRAAGVGEATFGEWMRLPADAVSARIRGLTDNQSYDLRLSYTTTLGQVADAEILTAVPLAPAASVIGAGPLEAFESSNFSLEDVQVFTGEQLLDFEVVDADVSLLGDGIQFSATGPNPTLKFPPWFSFAGSVADQVHLLIQRVGGADWEFEEISLRWATEGAAPHGVSDLNRVRNPARIASAGFSVFPFDATVPTSGSLTDWVEADLIKDLEIRFPASATDAYYIPAIRVGRVLIAPAGRGAGPNLIAGEIATRLAVDSDANARTYAVVQLARQGVSAGSVLKCSALQQAYGSRQARLLARFRGADNSILSDTASAWTDTQTSLALAEVLVTVPPGADRLTLLLDVSATGTGLVEGREPVIINQSDWDGIADTSDGRKPDDYADVTWNSLLEPARSFNFEGQSAGWIEQKETTGTVTPDGWDLLSTGSDPFIMSPDRLDIPVEQATTVIVRLSETAGTPWGFDQLQLFYTTQADGAFTGDKTVIINRTLQAGVDGIVQFDLANAPNYAGVLRRLRLDYADAAGEGVKIKEIIIGRARLPRNVTSNLYGQAYLTNVGAADIDTNSQIGPVIQLAENGLEAGETVDYVSIEIEASAARRGRLLVRFRDAANTIVQDYTGRWIGDVFGFAKSELRNIVIPGTADRFAVILEREDGVSGLVGARRPIAHSADAIARADVEAGANLTTDTAQLIDSAGLGVTATWSGVSGSGKPADDATVGAQLGSNLLDDLGSPLDKIDTRIIRPEAVLSRKVDNQGSFGPTRLIGASIIIDPPAVGAFGPNFRFAAHGYRYSVSPNPLVDVTIKYNMTRADGIFYVDDEVSVLVFSQVWGVVPTGLGLSFSLPKLGDRKHKFQASFRMQGNQSYIYLDQFSLEVINHKDTGV